MKSAAGQAARQNASAHDRISTNYDASHGEIFNDTEQARLRQALKMATSVVATGTTGQLRALDFGCGTGNVARHLLELGFEVTAADVSSRSLKVLVERYSHLGKLYTTILSDAGLPDVELGRFDLVATYSVLHHVPDYLLCIQNLLRFLHPGGILYVDHEVSPQYWNPPAPLVELREISQAPVSRFQKMRDPRRVLSPRWWYEKIRRTMNPRYMPEGDIHVWPDDHIEWDRIVQVLASARVEVVHTEDYLVFRSHYDPVVYSKYASVCADMRLLIARTACASSVPDPPLLGPDR